MSNPASSDSQVLIDLAQRMGIPAVDAVRRVVDQLTSRELAPAAPPSETDETDEEPRPPHPRRPPSDVAGSDVAGSDAAPSTSSPT